MSDYKEWVSDYDKQVNDFDSHGHDVLFGMSFDDVSRGETILDIGIGTGLASIKFSKLGLKVFGVDSSQEMLDACEKKSFTEELKYCDIAKEQIPYPDNSFDHVICCGVLHFLGDIENFVKEVCRVMKPAGIFAFSVAPQNSNEAFQKEDTAWGVPIYKHSIDYVRNILIENGFNLQKEQRLLMKGADKVNYDMLFSALVARYE